MLVFGGEEGKMNQILSMAFILAARTPVRDRKPSLPSPSQSV